MTLRKIIAALFASEYCFMAAAGGVEGGVADRTTREPLIGAIVRSTVPAGADWTSGWMR